MALNKLDENNDGPELKANSKIIILISDGEDFGENTSDAVDDVENKDYKLFTLGVGTQKGGNIYAGNALKTDREGKPVLTKLDPKSLKSLASSTGGTYFEINDSRNDVARLISTIGKIEGEVRDARTLDVTANKYFFFLLVGAALLLIDILVNVPILKI